MIRHLVTFTAVAALTCGACLWWLHDGDVADAVRPVLPEWDAAELARRAGVAQDPPAEPAP